MGSIWLSCLEGQVSYHQETNASRSWCANSAHTGLSGASHQTIRCGVPDYPVDSRALWFWLWMNQQGLWLVQMIGENLWLHIYRIQMSEQRGKFGELLLSML